MTALDNAKAALENGWGVYAALRDLIAEHERLTAPPTPDEETRHLAFEELRRIDDELDAEPDLRLQAWDQLVAHPVFTDCYDTPGPLLEALLAKLDALTAPPTDADVEALAAVISDARADDDFDLGEFIGDRPLARVIIAATGRRFLPGTITEGMVEAAARALVGDAMTDKQWAHYMGEHHMAGYFMGARRALEAAARAQQEER